MRPINVIKPISEYMLSDPSFTKKRTINAPEIANGTLSKIMKGSTKLSNCADSTKKMKQLQTDLDAFSVSISFRNPMTNALEENVACIVPTDEVKYYTIQANKVLFNAFEIKFIEL